MTGTAALSKLLQIVRYVNGGLKMEDKLIIWFVAAVCYYPYLLEEWLVLWLITFGELIVLFLFPFLNK